jgi:23S rRNA (pseudouridine1915-N3)-methyltransferase
MKITLAAILPRKPKQAPHPPEALFADYAQRIARYLPGDLDVQRFPTEVAMLTWLDQQAGRSGPHLILLDGRGKQRSSEDLAALVGRHRDSATQHLVFAIGPADGWSAATRARANLLLSFGPITLPHELARVVLAEQLYRALTILAGHPYHSGH